MRNTRYFGVQFNLFYKYFIARLNYMESPFNTAIVLRSSKNIIIGCVLVTVTFSIFNGAD